jgi:putative NADPH-quinone reductase
MCNRAVNNTNFKKQVLIFLTVLINDITSGYQKIFALSLVMKKITIIVGHPSSDSLSGAFAKNYEVGAKLSGAEVKIVYLGDLKFDPILKKGYKKRQDWEPDIKDTVDKLLWADHWVFAFPIWWGDMPALLKGFFDRAFLSGVMFKYQDNSPLPLQLMKGKTARVIATMDGPLSYYRLFVGRPIELLFKKSILGFCGVSPVNFTYFSQVHKASPEKISIWEKQVETLGKRLI